MQVRTAIEVRLAQASEDDVSTLKVRLPQRLKSDKTSVRIAMFQRLAASRLFAYGDRAGCLRAAQNRSGRPFRLDVRQRVTVKALVSRHMGKGFARGAALAAHIAYLARMGAGEDGERAAFFGPVREGVDAADATEGWAKDRHHFRFIISPEHGDRISDLQSYTREVMSRVANDLGEPRLNWIAVCHFDTDQPHAHVLVRGRRSDGRDLVIPRDYIGYGFRARAQEVAQERLGDLSRQDAERRIWRETEADRFTAFDRRLLAASDSNGYVDDGIGGTDAWTALTRGRLRHLEGLGLATRTGRRFGLAPDMEARLRRLQLSKDIIRTLNQRRLNGALSAEQLGKAPVHGEVIMAGFHDELGGSPFVVVRSSGGREFYGRLNVGQGLPKVGKSITLSMDARGVALIVAAGQRGASLSRE
ncbi:MAG: relaxase/mobilization nuclease domain-containing protein [Brevundimonas sp.]|nr:relaxase/mobilization nuclease domain-containing protein [Brevundimonas sp.]